MEEIGELHLVMFPWLAFGHMIPYLDLSKLLAQKGHKISFVSTPRNIDRLPNLSSLIQFVKLPLPHVDNLPDNAECTIDLPIDQVKYLKIAFDGLEEALVKFLQDSSPDWVIHDFAPYWLAPTASKLNISTAHFSAFAPPALGFLGPIQELKGVDMVRTKPEDCTVKPKWVTFESSVAFRLYEILQVFDHTMVEVDDNVSDIFRTGVVLENVDLVIVRGCSDFEPEWLKLFEELYKKPVIPVGQLSPSTFDSDDGNSAKDDAWKESKDWLDRQTRGSVVFVGFGSEVKLTQDQLSAIALGIELSGLPFFFVLKTRRGETDDEGIELPKGFQEQTKDRGVVFTSWAPQLKILSHDSVGGYFFHSGWGSVVEAVQFEKPLILLTFVADQGLNARVLEETKMGYSIPRNEVDGSFTSDAWQVYRDKIKEIKDIFCDSAKQDFYLDNLLQHLQAHKRNN
ncbi:glycosyltransferase [Lithospermum erythrorhizon]|uniref:Glycosyltransferase n=1 Tax=Lithospermum erythrorhizon TaxID=34254 RepID=A0AAV3QQV4_LITER